MKRKLRKAPAGHRKAPYIRECQGYAGPGIRRVAARGISVSLWQFRSDRGALYRRLDANLRIAEKAILSNFMHRQGHGLFLLHFDVSAAHVAKGMGTAAVKKNLPFEEKE